MGLFSFTKKNMKEKILLSWSGGKDSALALYKLLQTNLYEITLLTTVLYEQRIIGMHGISEELLIKQANCIGLPLEIVYIKPGANNLEFENAISAVLLNYKAAGYTSVAFGDLYLEDIRAYRENNMKATGMKCLFPLWQKDTTLLANEFIDLGFKTVISCVDTQQLHQSFSGRLYDKTFLNELPKTTDPCGENGEFHSFVYDGPIFKKAVDFNIGKKRIVDDRFYFTELLYLN
jgi:uncharacterized protein (TIGR00290 family)